MLFINLFLFGLLGITIWAIQMLWIPFFAAGVINGIGHYWGYRNFECPEAAKNIVPWGFWIGGEELHNNHHAFASSAKFSIKWWEFDIGWLYIRLLCLFKLAKVKKLPPKLIIEKGKLNVDLDTVKAVISNRFQVMANYYKKVMKPVLKYERKSTTDRKLFSRAGFLLRCENKLLSSKAKIKLYELLKTRSQLQIVYSYKQSLQNIWMKTTHNQKELVEALQHWCRQAEASGLEVLQQFAIQLRGYVSQN